MPWECTLGSIIWGWKAIVKFLVENGADTNVQEAYYGNTLGVASYDAKFFDSEWVDVNAHEDAMVIHFK